MYGQNCLGNPLSLPVSERTNAERSAYIRYWRAKGEINSPNGEWQRCTVLLGGVSKISKLVADEFEHTKASGARSLVSNLQHTFVGLRIAKVQNILKKHLHQVSFTSPTSGKNEKKWVFVDDLTRSTLREERNNEWPGCLRVITFVSHMTQKPDVWGSPNFICSSKPFTILIYMRSLLLPQELNLNLCLIVSFVFFFGM